MVHEGGAQSFFPMNTGAPGSSASGQDAMMWVCNASWRLNLYSNLCGEAKGGSFGSKFVTVCVSGNDQNQIVMKGYQVLSSRHHLVHNIVCLMSNPNLACNCIHSNQYLYPYMYYMHVIIIIIIVLLEYLWCVNS